MSYRDAVDDLKNQSFDFENIVLGGGGAKGNAYAGVVEVSKYSLKDMSKFVPLPESVQYV